MTSENVNQQKLFLAEESFAVFAFFAQIRKIFEKSNFSLLLL